MNIFMYSLDVWESPHLDACLNNSERFTPICTQTYTYISICVYVVTKC